MLDLTDLLTDALTPVFDGNHIAAANAARTAVITFEGQDSIGNEWGLGCRVVMETSRGNVMQPLGAAHWAVSRSGVVGHSKRALETLLEPCGFNWSDVERVVTRPTKGRKEAVTLNTLVNRLLAAA